MNDATESQRRFWNDWNATQRETAIGDVSRDQREVVLEWLSRHGRHDLDIIDVGCGAGWLCSDLIAFGRVTATDLSDEVLERARARLPQVRFVAGDFMALDFGAEAYDVVVSLEVLSHVADGEAFLEKVAAMLKPGGVLMLATQNRAVLERQKHVSAADPHQLRRWYDEGELRRLLSARFDIKDIRRISPRADHGIGKLVAGHAARRFYRAFNLRTLEHAIANAGFAWTLIARAEKRM